MSVISFLTSRHSMSQTQLTDTFGRTHNYLRISLTDKCNFRCTYCMPDEKMKFMPSAKLMTADEIIQLTSVFQQLGVNKVRLTGGEPTLRKDLMEIISGIIALGITPSITTNGATIHQFIEDFQKNEIDINISIDTLQKEKFAQISQRDLLDPVKANIEELVRRKLKVKLNVVLLRGFNDNEIIDLVNYAGKLGIEIRFIEYMPFFGNSWEYEKVYTRAEILKDISDHAEIQRLKSPDDSTSVNYVIPSTGARFGIISTVSNPFCQGCSRLRLTADGKMKNCLFSNDETDLLTALRHGQNLIPLIQENISRKKKTAAGRIDFNHEKAAVQYAQNRSMIAIGG